MSCGVHCGPSLSQSCLSTAGGVGSSTPFVAALGGGALLTPAPLNISGVANVVILPAMAGAIFYCADLRSIQVPCGSFNNRIPMNSFSDNNLGILDLQAAATSFANGRDTLSNSSIRIADLQATALGCANRSTHHQQLPVSPPVNLSSTVPGKLPAPCRELFNIPKLATLTEYKPLVHQCNVHETERHERQVTKQANTDQPKKHRMTLPSH